MVGYPTVQLSDVCEVRIGRTPRRDTPRFWGGDNPWATVGELGSGELLSTKEGITDEAVAEVMPPPVEPGTLLFSFKLSIGKMAFAGVPLHHNEAIAALPIRDPDRLDAEFLYYALRAKTHDTDASHAVLGKVLNKAKVNAIEIPLPPIEEQRRIVDILNRAASIERLKARASAHLRDFIPALFLKMFGDPIENPMGWPVEKLASLVVDGARNGLSPSRKGLVRGQVLTLSAITRGAFDPNALKEGTFSHPIPAEQTVTKDRFLLCRGNGNLGLVGRGHFPSIDMPGIAFPDTIISVEPRKDRVEPAFLEALWETRYIREQVERAAKTTNGTYKINQGSLLDFQIPVPPIADQRKFARLVAAARSRMALATSSAELASDLSRSLLDLLLTTERAA